jgi:hypothetical protein
VGVLTAEFLKDGYRVISMLRRFVPIDDEVVVNGVSVRLGQLEDPTPQLLALWNC